MANTTKTTKSATTKAEPKVEVNMETKAAVDMEKEMLKKQMAEMQAQMELMAKMISAAQEIKTEPVQKTEKQIPFINMTCGDLILRGNTIYRVQGQFTERKFLEREARIIVNNMRNAIEQGCVYIADADFVKECELDHLYANMLNKEQLETLLEHDASYVVEVYKNVADGMKDVIVDMITNKRLNAQQVDANILMQIGAIANRDLINIEPDE